LKRRSEFVSSYFAKRLGAYDSINERLDTLSALDQMLQFCIILTAAASASSK